MMMEQPQQQLASLKSIMIIHMFLNKESMCLNKRKKNNCKKEREGDKCLLFSNGSGNYKYNRKHPIAYVSESLLTRN